MEKEIKVYTTPICPYCITLKEFLKDKGVEFEQIDVSKDREAAKEMIEKSGQRGVPVLEVDGEIVVGFNKKKIKNLLNLD